ncbi:MAG: CoB--CoM heterodisulfide reductase iron-sulfur subunit B family protein, partial [Thermodesulfobacteriota bacterium]
PLRNIDFNVFLLSSARNIALSESRNLDILTLCKYCYGTLKKAGYFLKENPSIKEEVNKIIKKEGLEYEGRSQIKHILTALYKDYGLDTLKENMRNLYNGIQIATYYGCHILRPSKVVEFDDPVKPRIFDELVEITGAKSIEWRMKLECRGAPF